MEFQQASQVMTLGSHQAARPRAVRLFHHTYRSRQRQRRRTARHLSLYLRILRSTFHRLRQLRFVIPTEFDVDPPGGRSGA